MAMAQKRVLVTGATGFVGRALCPRLLSEGWLVRAAVLADDPSGLPEGVERARIEPVGASTPWDAALAGVDTVLHLAARVHIMSDPSHDPLRDFLEVNAVGTDRLAWEAARAGVRRLVFVSSVKVNGEETETPYTEAAPAQPDDPYGVSKLEAEKALRRVAAETGLEVVIVRPTLVYGPSVRANFLNMLKVLRRGIPLPLGSIENRRSLIFIGNLVDALALCLRHPAAAGETFLVSDGEDVSTSELLQCCARALGVGARLFSVPLPLLRLGALLTGKEATLRRLTGSLAVDSGKIRERLGWRPPFTLQQGLQATARWYLQQGKEER